MVVSSLRKLIVLFADAHVLPDLKLSRLDSNAHSLGIHSTPHGEESASFTSKGAMPVVECTLS